MKTSQPAALAIAWRSAPLESVIPSAQAKTHYYGLTMPHASNAAEADDIDRRLIDLRHTGTPWDECAKKLHMTTPALQLRARRLRDSKQWRLSDGRPARGAPKRGQRGRPRAIVPRTPISPRFAPDVDAALRTVAACANLRLGEILTEAMQRAVDRAAGERVSKTPLGLDPGSPFQLCNGIRSAVMAVNVPRPLYEALVALDPDKPAMTAIADAAHQLLADLNYQIVECGE